MIELDNETTDAVVAPSIGTNSNEQICLSDEEELAIGQRWDPLGEEKEESVTLADKDILNDRWVLFFITEYTSLTYHIIYAYIHLYI